MLNLSGIRNMVIPPLTGLISILGLIGKNVSVIVGNKNKQHNGSWAVFSMFVSVLCCL